MSDSRPMLHMALLHGVQQPSALRECVRTLANAAGALVQGPSTVFAGDEIERGQSGPDRRRDLSGDPLYLILTPLAPHAVEAGMDGAAAHLGRCSARLETWSLRECFARVAQRIDSSDESWLQIIMMNIEASVESEFNEWYEQEHAMRIGSEAPEFVSVRRFEAIDGSPRHHAFWRLTDRKAPERDPWLSASDTPWTRRMRRFMRDRRRLLMAPIAA